MTDFLTPQSISSSSPSLSLAILKRKKKTKCSAANLLRLKHQKMEMDWVKTENHRGYFGVHYTSGCFWAWLEKKSHLWDST